MMNENEMNKGQQELLAYVRARLDDDCAEADDYDPHETMAPGAARTIVAQNAYDLAKDSAWRGDHGPLFKIFAAFDPELLSLIKAKPQPRRRRKPSGKPFRDLAQAQTAASVKRIRELIVEKIEVQPTHKGLIEIAAEILKIDPETISKIIHRGNVR